MTSQPVARVGDVVTNADIPRPGTFPAPPATPTATGNWKAGPVSYTPDPTGPPPRITAGGRAVVVKATCVFTFTGNDNATGALITPAPTATVELVPGAHPLRVGNAAPLVNGNTKTDEHGNTLTVVSTATWRTA